jgi:long-chain acyl-CoA synthetase
LIASITGESIANVSDLSRLSEDLHLDSLGRVQLQSSLEQQLGIELDDSALDRLETLGDLHALLQAQSGAPTAEDSANKASTRPVPENPQGHGASQHTYPKWPWSPPIRLLRVLFIEAAMRPLISLLAAPHVVRDTNPSADSLSRRPLLLIANHVTSFDGALVLYALPRTLRHRVAIAMSGEMLLDLRNARNQGSWILNALAPVQYWLLTALFNVFPMPRSSGFQRSFAHAGEALDHGYSVLIFPEGHRSEDGVLQPFRPGIGLLVQQSQADILPIALKGLGEMKTKKQSWFRSGKLEIHVGQIVPFDNSVDPGEQTRALEQIIGRL